MHHADTKEKLSQLLSNIDQLNNDALFLELSRIAESATGRPDWEALAAQSYMHTMSTTQVLSSLADFGFFVAGVSIASIIYCEILGEIRKRRSKNKVVFRDNSCSYDKNSDEVEAIKNMLKAAYSAEIGAAVCFERSEFNALERYFKECGLELRKALFDAHSVFGESTFLSAKKLLNSFRSPIDNKEELLKTISAAVNEIELEAKELIKK